MDLAPHSHCDMTSALSQGQSSRTAGTAGRGAGTPLPRAPTCASTAAMLLPWRRPPTWPSSMTAPSWPRSRPWFPPTASLGTPDPDTQVSPGSLTAALRAAGARRGAQAVARLPARPAGLGPCGVRASRPSRRPGQGCLPVAPTSPSPPGPPRARAWRAWPSPTSTSTTATAPRRCSRPIRSVLFASVHEWPAYTGRAWPARTGVGNIANATVAPGAPREAWRAAFAGLVSRIDAFAPDIILISAGVRAPTPAIPSLTSPWRRRISPGHHPALVEVANHPLRRPDRLVAGRRLRPRCPPDVRRRSPRPRAWRRA